MSAPEQPSRIQLRRVKGWRLADVSDNAVVVARPNRWGNPFRYRTRTALARVPALDGSEWEYEGRISADGARHDYHHPDGHITVHHVRYMTLAECVEMFRRCLIEPTPHLHLSARIYERDGSGRRRLTGSEWLTADLARRELGGKDLACWCPPGPCHADVLLAAANEPASEGHPSHRHPTGRCVMTGIQWTDTVWNPTTGCDKVSPGCGLPRFEGDDTGGCYAMAMAKRLKGMGQEKYQNDGDPRTSGPGFGFTMHEAALTVPLKWRKPRRVFVNSMSDLFHQDATRDFIARAFAVMAATPQHTYQILTKRPGKMRSILRDECRCGAGHAPGVHFRSLIEWAATPHSPTYVPGLKPGVYHDAPWPLPNVHLGTSVERQEEADLRIPALLETPATVRFLSCEPLLGPVDLLGAADAGGHRARPTYWLTGRPGWGPEHQVGPGGLVMRDLEVGPRISWVIVGGESGPDARPMELDWARSLVKQCQQTDVAVFVKQLGSVHGRALGGGKGGDPGFWPDGLNVREFPAVSS